MDEVFNIQFGDQVWGIVCADKISFDFLKAHFSAFISNAKAADARTVITFLNNREPPSILPGSYYTCTITDDRFNFGPDFIRGYYDPEGATFHLAIAKNLFQPDFIWLFDRILCRLFFTVAESSNEHQHNAFVIHSAGVAKDGKGYLFFGPPESGKSTIAQLSAKYTVLHDDMNLIIFDEKSIYLQGVPFNPKGITLSGIRVPLAAVFSINKARTAGIERLSYSEFTGLVLPETFLPLSLFSNNKQKPFQKVLNITADIWKKVPCFRLNFRKDETFWNSIEQMETGYAKY